MGTFRWGPRAAVTLLTALLAGCGGGDAGSAGGATDVDAARPDEPSDDAAVDASAPDAAVDASAPDAAPAIDASTTDADTPAPDSSSPAAPRSATGPAAAAGVTRSDRYRMVSSLGRPAAGRSTATSPRFRLQDGPVGAAGGSR